MPIATAAHVDIAPMAREDLEAVGRIKKASPLAKTGERHVLQIEEKKEGASFQKSIIRAEEIIP